MERRAGGTTVHFAEHGSGLPVLVLHGAYVDHREMEACIEPVFGPGTAPASSSSEDSGSGLPGLSSQRLTDLRPEQAYRRIYPDLPGMGRTPAPDSLRSADGVCDLLLGFLTEVGVDDEFLLIGHSAGAHFAAGLAARCRERVAGLALICPLLPDLRDVPEHRPVIAADGLGDEEFRNYFVVQTPAMLERHERYIAPAIPLTDSAAMERIGRQWELPPGETYEGPTLVVAGRRDSTVGCAAAAALVDEYPAATLAVLEDAGHALPHEKPALLAGLLRDWLLRTEAARAATTGR